MQRFAQPEPVRRYNKSVPIEVEAIVMQLLEKDPERRIPNATVLARRLEATFRGLATLAIRQQQDGGGEDAGFDIASSTSTPGPGDNPGDLAQTRVATRPASAGGVSPSDATQAAEREGADPKPTDSEVRRAGRRFTTVEEQPVGLDTDRVEPARWLSPQTILFLIGLMAVGLVVAYFLQPPSADTLYDRIKERLASGDPADLLACEDDVKLFLTYYTPDPRSREIERLGDDIELTALENRLENKAKIMGSTAQLSLVERAFLEAIRLEAIDPPTCVEKLEAISQLYPGGRGAPTTNGQRCVLLASRRAARLKTAAQNFVEEHTRAKRAPGLRRLRRGDRTGGCPANPASGHPPLSRQAVGCPPDRAAQKALDAAASKP